MVSRPSPSRHGGSAGPIKVVPCCYAQTMLSNSAQDQGGGGRLGRSNVASHRNVRLLSLLSYCPVGWRNEVLRLLVVEDEPIIGHNLVMIAEELGFNVDGPATNAASSLRLATLNPPDIAIVDVNLTDGPTGPAIAAHLAAAFGTAVLIVSANPEAVTLGEGGVAAILTKPVDERDVISVLCMFSARCADAVRARRLEEPSWL